MEYPRVLVVTSNNFNLVTGGGITLTNLFDGWPPDCIANLHEDAQPEDRSVCRSFYRLSGDEIHWVWPLTSLQPRSNGTGALAAPVDSQSSTAGVSRWLFGDGVPRAFTLSPELARWIDAFQPQLIYSFLGSMAQIRLFRALVSKLAIPSAVHIMDDWPSVIYRRGVFGSAIRRRVMSEFKEILGSASLRLGICEEMCKEYQVRFGYSFLPFHNAVDVAGWAPLVRHHWKSGNPFVVRYAGSIVEEAQRESLRDVCRAVSKLRKTGMEIELWVHSPSPQRQYLLKEEPDGLILRDPPDPATIAELLSSADILVLPFNFDAHSAQYIRLSMPTKVPAYMASGTPVLLYGPADIAPVRYALRDGWGYVVFQQGVSNVAAAITRLYRDQHLRELHGRRAQTLAAERHDLARVRESFQSALASAVSGAFAGEQPTIANEPA